MEILKIQGWSSLPACAHLSRDLMFRVSFSVILIVRYITGKLDGTRRIRQPLISISADQRALRSNQSLGMLLQGLNIADEWTWQKKMCGKGNSSGVTTILALIYHVCEEAKRVKSDAVVALGHTGRPDSPLFVLLKIDMYAEVRQRIASAFLGVWWKDASFLTPPPQNWLIRVIRRVIWRCAGG